MAAATVPLAAQRAAEPERGAAGGYRLKVAVSVVVYWASVSAVPIYNKMAFSRQGQQGGGGKKFPYPIATAFLQLGLVAFVLAAAGALGRALRGPEASGSWVLGPHLCYKLRQVAWPGLLFGLKYGVTNWGLQLLPTGAHLLLQATDLLWTVVVARVLLKEQPGDLEKLAVLLSSLGSLLVGLRSAHGIEAGLLPLAVNLAAPLLLALCVVTLRRATLELLRPDNRLGGRVSPAEITALKLSLSSAVALALSLCLENGHVQLATGSAGERQQPAWWRALAADGAAGLWEVLVGGIFVLVFQVNLTWLAGMASAVTVGIVGGLKVVPQWFASAAAQGKLDLAPLDLLGVALVLGASVLYSAAVSSASGLSGRRCAEAAKLPERCTLYTGLAAGLAKGRWAFARQAALPEARRPLVLTAEGAGA